MIYDNGALGIDLVPGGVTLNDAGDADFGSNLLRELPVLTSIVHNGSGATIGGTLNSTANTTFTVDLYDNTSSDPTGYGEGRTPIGTTSTSCTTDGAGNCAFSVVVSAYPVLVHGHSDRPRGEHVRVLAGLLGSLDPVRRAGHAPARRWSVPTDAVAWSSTGGGAVDPRGVRS